MTYHQDFHVRQGETFEFVYVHVNSGGSLVDLSGYSADMRVASGYEGIYEAFLSSGPDADGGTIELGGAAGTVAIKFTAEQSSAIAGNLSEIIFVEPQKRAERDVKFVYDLELRSPSGVVTRVLEGDLWLQRGVTNWL